MKTFLSVAVAAVALLGATQAHAQDDWRKGLYIKGGAGWNHAADSDYAGGEVEFDDGYALSGAVGYDYGDVRAEMEVAYRNNDVDSFTAGGVALAAPSGDVSSTAFMANGYYDIPTGGPFTPYIGAGVGVAQVNVNDYSAAGVALGDDDDAVFAYQAMAGAEYAVAPQVDLFTEYKYFATSDVDVGGTDASYDNHAIMVGAKYNLN